MAFKIKNVTNKLVKRHPHSNSELKFQYWDGAIQKEETIPVGGEVIIETHILPVSIHKHQVRGLVHVVSLSENQLNQLRTSSEKPVVKQNIPTKEDIKAAKKAEQVQEVIAEAKKESKKPVEAKKPTKRSTKKS